MERDSLYLDTPDRGTAILLLPGLNMRPEALLPLAEAIRRRGSAVSLVGLGFTGRSGTMLATWRETARDAFEGLSREYARVVPAGFSLGAALALDLALRQPDPGEILLIAPPLCLRTATVLVRAASLLPGVCIPSAAPAAVRKHRFLSGRAYRAFFRLRRELLSSCDGLEGFTGRVILQEGDEIVSCSSSRRFFADFSGIDVTVLPRSSGRLWRHLPVVPESGSWDALLAAVLP